MSNYVTMSYGNYNFNPIPQVTLNREFKKTEDERILFSEYKLGLAGSLTPYPSGTGGLTALMALRSGLAAAMNMQGCEFSINCGGNNLLTCNPKINNVSFAPTQNNWVNSINYNIDMAFKDMKTGEIPYATGLSSVSENWNMDISEDKPYYSWTVANAPNAGIDMRPLSYKLTHSLSAKGSVNYNSCGTIDKEGWEHARAFCSGQLGNTGVFSLPQVAKYTQLLNYIRTQREDRFAGQYTIEETWLIFTSGSVSGNATEDFAIDIKQNSESDIISVGINGTIHGLEKRTYSTLDSISASITQDKYSNALTYWKNLSFWQVPYLRCQQALTNSNVSGITSTTTTTVRPLNILRFDKSVGQNIPNGTINYSYNYTNKPTPCVANALAEDISFNIDYPQDVFASVPILGRAAGPVLQLMGTRTHYGINMSVEVLVPINTSCTTTGLFYLLASTCPHASVKSLMTDLENSLYAQYAMVVKASDKIGWKPREGKYNRNVSWVCVPCLSVDSKGIVTATGTSVSYLP